MDNIKKYRNIILVILIILGFVFYWYEWRPRQIKKECNIFAIKEAQNFYKNEYSYERQKIEEGYYEVNNYESYYQQCSREKRL
ncbi:MAG: hypothetical protein Q7R61_01005 [bacterium]|nr:hypothetical protein [bacterium]